MKIWFGDEKAGGAVALITLDPLRTVIGWGPESMFVAYNQVYPPTLANVEARGASPDRSHEAYLDELVTKGVLGLISYLFVLISFFALAWRLARRVQDWRTQVLVIACVAAVVSFCIEGLLASRSSRLLMMFWLTLAVLVVTGALAGQYTLDAATQQEPEPVPEPALATPTLAAKPAGGKARLPPEAGVPARAQRRAAPHRAARWRGGECGAMELVGRGDLRHYL